MYNKKASLLEGDLEATLERLQHAASQAMPREQGDHVAGPRGEGRGGAARGAGAGKAAAVGGRGQDGEVPREAVLKDAAAARVAMAGAARKGDKARGTRAVAQAEGEVQEWVTELGAAEEEEVFLRRSSGGFAGCGSQGAAADSSLWGNAQGSHGNGHLLLPLGAKGALGGFSQLQQQQQASGLPLRKQQSVPSPAQGSLQGAGLEGGDEMFEDGGVLEWDLRDLDLDLQEAALLTQVHACLCV